MTHYFALGAAILMVLMVVGFMVWLEYSYRKHTRYIIDLARAPLVFPPGELWPLPRHQDGLLPRLKRSASLAPTPDKFKT